MPVSKKVWKTLLLTSTIVLLRCLAQVEAHPESLPSSYLWNGLMTDTVQISYSFGESIWYGGTGYLHIDARAGQGTYSDSKSTTARLTIPEGFSAVVYVCGDDRNPVPNGWTVVDKYLRVYVDGVRVYELGKEYWWPYCYSKAATLSQGTHEVKLTIGITVKVSSCFEERDLHYAAMDIRLEGGGTMVADTHSAEAVLDGSVTHVFTFTLPQATGVRNMSWKAVWNGVEKTGCGAPGSTQKAVFQGVNRDSWVFTSPVAIRVGEPAPSVGASDGFAIDEVFDEGSGEAGIRRVAVAISNGDEVGFASGEYLVTSIEYLGLNITGCTFVEGLDAWANSGSSVHWSQKIRFYSAGGWVVEEAANGVETGSCVMRKLGGGAFSRRVVFSSRNRTDELTLTISLPQISLRFDSMRIEPLGPTDLGLRMLGETVELRVKVSDCLGEYSKIDVYSVSESSPGVRKYSFSPPKGVYRSISSTTGGNATFTVTWSSYRLTVKSVSGGVLRSGVYWARSGSTVSITVSAYFSHDGSPAAGVRIRDSQGKDALTGMNGDAVFSFAEKDREARLTFVAVGENGARLSEEACVRIVFTQIRLEVSSLDAVFFEESYYACNNGSSSFSVKAVYSHSLTPASSVLVEFKPSGSSALTGVDGAAALRLTGRDVAYEGMVKASDGFIEGEATLRVVFTRILLEASRTVVGGRPGEEVEVTVSARLSFNNMPLKGIEVRWVETGLVGRSPASFRLRIPEKGVSKASFNAAGFLPCVEPCTVTLVPNWVRLGNPEDNGPRVFVNNIPLENYSFRVMLNIMDLLNITIPRVVWQGNGSIARGIRIGVVSSNGTVVRSSLVSSNGVSFNWTESKPGVYRYYVKALEENVCSDVLSIEAVFTAFNITPDYVLDRNGTRIFCATARWAHNGSPVSSLPVYTSLSAKRVLSDDEGRIRLALNDSEYNASCVERIVVLKRDPHPSGIWRTVGDCSVRIVRLNWSSLVLKGDQYGFEAFLRLEADAGMVSLPMRIRVEGYPPETSCSIRVLQVQSDNSSMTVFLSPSGGLFFDERLALRIDYAEYDGRMIRVRVRSLAKHLVVRGVRVKVVDTGFEKNLGDLEPGSCLETSLELPGGQGLNPVVLVAYSENTVPHSVRVWSNRGVNLFPLISVTPLLAALALRMRRRRRGFKESGRKTGKSGVNQDPQG
ncbi:MAG: hypothetical protein FGF50_01200 [Candidatus Brockarchaeota archaeon]|nr:hypothetical protein [Candidatus Brockarchaeota archaeon]